MNMPFNLFRPKGKLGIDIGTSAIKIVELDKENNRFVLKNYGLFEFKGSGAITQTGESKQIQSILKLPDGEIIWGIKEVLSRQFLLFRLSPRQLKCRTFPSRILPRHCRSKPANTYPFRSMKWFLIGLSLISLQIGSAQPSQPRWRYFSRPCPETKRYDIKE